MMVDFKPREGQRFNPQPPEIHVSKGTLNMTVRQGKPFHGDKYLRVSDLKTGRVRKTKITKCFILFFPLLVSHILLELSSFMALANVNCLPW